MNSQTQTNTVSTSQETQDQSRGVPFWKSGLFLIAGPCVLRDTTDEAIEIGTSLKGICEEVGLPYCFKASFDKANRSSASSYRGPGLEKGLDMLEEIRARIGVPVLTDIHSADSAAQVAGSVDVLQIPALLCRQTDIVEAAAETGRPINIKKGQFMAPWEMENVVEKARRSGARDILLTERGTSFGYNNLVSDLRSIPIMQRTGCPVIFDATHSVQLPGGQGTVSGGQREFAPVLARAAVAAGCDGIFFEVYPEPDDAVCDGPNATRLDSMRELLKQFLAIHRATETIPGQGES